MPHGSLAEKVASINEGDPGSMYDGLTILRNFRTKVHKKPMPKGTQ